METRSDAPRNGLGYVGRARLGAGRFRVELLEAERDLLVHTRVDVEPVGQRARLQAVVSVRDHQVVLAARMARVLGTCQRPFKRITTIAARWQNETSPPRGGATLVNLNLINLYVCFNLIRAGCGILKTRFIITTLYYRIEVSNKP